MKNRKSAIERQEKKIYNTSDKDSIGGMNLKVALISFTKNGFETEKRLVSALERRGHSAFPWVMGKAASAASSCGESAGIRAVEEGGLSGWTKDRFKDSEALIFVGALGVAVRAAAPYVKDKKTDPAVLDVDEALRFVIPLLSGHLGGANALAGELVEQLLSMGIAAQAVITTATDINKRFAVDVFAKERGMVIDDMKLAKEISAAVLDGEPVGFFSDFPVEGEIPEGLFKDRICRSNIRVTIWKKMDAGEEKRMLRLIPKCVVLGIGCRRGTSMEKLQSVLCRFMEENRLDFRSVCALASVDLKSREEGICHLSELLEIPFFTYPAEELASLPGEFTESAFVKKTTGVGNVCERAAMAACIGLSGNGRVLLKKHAEDGVTAAAAFFCPGLF